MAQRGVCSQKWACFPFSNLPQNIEQLGGCCQSSIPAKLQDTSKGMANNSSCCPFPLVEAFSLCRSFPTPRPTQHKQKKKAHDTPPTTSLRPGVRVHWALRFRRSPGPSGPNSSTLGPSSLRDQSCPRQESPATCFFPFLFSTFFSSVGSNWLKLKQF